MNNYKRVASNIKFMKKWAGKYDIERIAQKLYSTKQSAAFEDNRNLGRDNMSFKRRGEVNGRDLSRLNFQEPFKEQLYLTEEQKREIFKTDYFSHIKGLNFEQRMLQK